MPKISPQDLTASDKKKRFLQELRDHAQDSNDPGKLGLDHDLIQLFNAYVWRKRLPRLAILIAVGIVTSLPSAFFQYTDIKQNVLRMVTGELAMAFDVMSALTIPPLRLAIPAIGYGDLFPVLTGIAWSLYVGLILYPPHPSARAFTIMFFVLSHVLEGQRHPDGYNYFEATAPVFFSILILSLLIELYHRRPLPTYADR